MASYVWSAIQPPSSAAQQPGALVQRALDCARRADWPGAHDVLQLALRDRTERVAAHYLLWEVCQVLGHPDVAMANLHAALRLDPITTRPCTSPRRRVLAIATPGDFQANLPLGALLDPSETELHTLWLHDPQAVLKDPGSLGPLPSFDCAFISIAEDARHDVALQAADRLVDALQVPALNCGHRIAACSRETAANLLQGIAHAVVPLQLIATRTDLERSEPSIRLTFPLIIRPTASHAGRDLARVGSSDELQTYLERVTAEHFYVAPFADFRSIDGLWRKYRIIFVDGQPYPYHMAVHGDWAIWYYNAKMDCEAWKRAEESHFVEDLGNAFPQHAMEALYAIGERVGLDYFGLDCGLMLDGRLVVFEVETGMIVHDLDPPELFPYRRGSVERIRQATERMIDRHVPDWRSEAP